MGFAATNGGSGGAWASAAKKAKQTVTAGSEQLPWGDAVSCVIS